MTTNFEAGSVAATKSLPPSQHLQTVDHHTRPPPPLGHFDGEGANGPITAKSLGAGATSASPSATASGLVTFKGSTSASNFANMSNGNTNLGGDGNENGNDYNGSDKSVSIGSVIEGRNSRINNINNNSNGLKESKENLLQNNYNDDDLGPLPPNWETATTERGELYFIDHNTGTSHWLDPRLSKFQKKSLEDCTEDELPYGWEKIEDSLYGTYYIDHVNRRTQYENPVLEAKRRLAEQKQMRATTPAANQNGDAGNPSTKIVEPGGSRFHDGNDLGGKMSGSGNFYPPPKREMQIPPPAPLSSHPLMVGVTSQRPSLPYKFTKNPAEMRGERITTSLVKSARGLGITIIGGDEGVDEFLQIKSIVPNGPAWFDGQLQTGDVLVYVNETCVLGFTHNEMVNIFQSIMPGDTVTLEVCRGYPLPFDPNDPNTEVVTTIAVNGINPPETTTEKHRHQFLKSELDGNYNFVDTLKNFHQSGGVAGKLTKSEVLTFSIAKGAMGFGFTIADSAHGQRVKKILDRNCCIQLQEGDVLLEINDVDVRHKSHLDVVQILKDCSKTELTTVKIQRERSGSSGNVFSYPTTLNAGGGLNSGNIGKLYNKFAGSSTGLGFRSKTPTADLYSTQPKEILPIRPKTPLVDTRRPRVKTPDNELLDEHELKHKVGGETAKSSNSLHELSALNQDIPYLDPYPKLVTSLSERLAETTMLGGAGSRDIPDAYHGLPSTNFAKMSNHGAAEMRYEFQAGSQTGTFGAPNYVGQEYQLYGSTSMPPMLGAMEQPGQEYATAGQHLGNPSGARLYSSFSPIYLTGAGGVQPNYHHESCFCYECQEDPAKKYRQPLKQSPLLGYYGHHPMPMPASSSLLAPLDNSYHPHQLSPMLRQSHGLQDAHLQNERIQKRVNEIVSERRKVDFSPLDSQLPQHNFLPYTPEHSPMVNLVASGGIPGGDGMRVGGRSIGGGSTNGSMDADVQYELTTITLERQIMGFGFRIVGGTEEGSQVTVGHIVPGGAADNDHRIATGDEILSIDGINVVNASHHKVVSLMGEAALRGQVTMILRRRVLLPNTHLGLKTNSKKPSPSAESRFPYDVIVKRNENEGFGFVIISSSNQFYGSTIGKLIPGSPADRCGELKVGDRIVAVNQVDISAMSHGDVVNLIKESGLHVRLTIGCPKEPATGVASSSAPIGPANPMHSNSAQPSPDSAAQSHSQSTSLPLQADNESTANGVFDTASQPTQAAQLKL